MISFIFAVSQNNVIGINNKLPWNLPDDSKRFEDITRNHVVIMGRKTFESMESPLKDRENIVITRDLNYSKPNIQIFHTVKDVLNSFGYTTNEMFVVGGSEIFKLFLPYVDRIYMTRILKNYNGDTFLPEIKLDNWQITYKQDMYDKVSDTKYSYINYLKNN